MDQRRGHGIGDHREEKKEEDSHWTMAMVSSSMGTVNCLLNKLPTEWKLVDLRRVLEGIQHHLLGFCARGVVTNMLHRQWMKQLRELVYDIEDWIDMHLIDSGGRSKLDKMSSNDSTLLEEFEDYIDDLQDLGKRFGFLRTGFSDLVPVEVTLDLEDNTPGNILHGDWMLRGLKPCIVGLGRRQSEIVQHLMDNEQQLKVVSILGPGGMGKTTLARELFQKQRAHFECGALVSVGRYPCVAASLMDIARQIMPQSLVPCEENLVIDKLWEFLFTKRYLIVIDDIWSISSWRSISCAFPNNGLGSRILTTTEAEKLAKMCCVKPVDFVYSLKALSDGDSRFLMLTRMSFSEIEDCPVDPNILESMLKVCCGSPLAIVVGAGLLAAKGAGLNSALSSLIRQGSTSQEMAKILDMSFGDLPVHLKSCFLYLSAFPENCIIRKDRLIRRWIAEGFIPSRNGESMWGIGESYFKEIARRGLIQMVVSDDYDVIGCTIHNVIYDFVRSLSVEENFVTIGEHFRSGSYPCDTIRRFTHDCSKQFESGVLGSMTKHLSKVRSLSIFGNTNKQLYNSWNYTLVRVLDLEGATGLGKRQLRSIRSLLLLRYLGLRESDVYELPEQMELLQHLETIDLRQTKVKHLPLLATSKLVYLLADRLVLPRRMNDMLELEELSTILVDRRCSVESATKLVQKSKLLRVLGLRFECSVDHLGLVYFLTAVNNSDLQVLIVDDYSGVFLDVLLASGGPRISLQKFELNVSHGLSRVPAELAYVKGLTHLHIRVNQLEAEGLHILAELPCLFLLHLDSHGNQERCIISNPGCFEYLAVFWLSCLDSGMGLQFGPGVMPQLRRFKLVFSAEQTEHEYGGFDFGIQNLVCLEQVSVTINCSTPTSEAAAAIRDQVAKIPNSPLLELEICLD